MITQQNDSERYANTDKEFFWQQYFCWYPKRVNGRWFWLKTVWRKAYTIGNGNYAGHQSKNFIYHTPEEHFAWKLSGEKDTPILTDEQKDRMLRNNGRVKNIIT